MLNKAQNIYEDGKKSLDSLLRDKAYEDVKKSLSEKGIDINSVSNEDVETLVVAKTADMMNGIKGFGLGTAFAVAVSLVTGV